VEAASEGDVTAEEVVDWLFEDLPESAENGLFVLVEATEVGTMG
jgi:hypothetical protein